MKTHQGITSFKSSRRTVVTVGTFDGLHVGHQKIIDRLIQTAQSYNLESVVLTFFPHPRMVLQKDSDIKLINTIEERTQILSSIGLDHLVIHAFTKEFSRLSAQEYVEEVLVDKLNVKKIIIGYDHRFGRNRTASIKELRSFGEIYDFEVEEISKQEIEAVSVSSTKVRNAILEGDITLANQYLSYPFSIGGKVVKGKQLGRTLGYPTANIHVAEEYKIIPRNGVYIIRSVIDNQPYFGMMNIGNNPTVGGKAQTIEAYFFELSQDLYGSYLSVQLLKRIRDEENFESIEELVLAMKKDEAYSKEFLNKFSTRP
ncbi:bifunctional riboflavin kinase/FAD synthetase [Gangjinia marincola]|uniref:Riboflavin biosynthesis protein n=1 Tax=Gangjinia marincola TaxID=578463 RepID=A0ABP3XZG8_9FLAO